MPCLDFGCLVCFLVPCGGGHVQVCLCWVLAGVARSSGEEDVLFYIYRVQNATRGSPVTFSLLFRGGGKSAKHNLHASTPDASIEPSTAEHAVLLPPALSSTRLLFKTAGVQAQVPQGHEPEPACPPAAPHSVRAREANPVVVHPGAHRDRLPVRGHRLQLHHHARSVRGHEPRLLPEVPAARGEGASRIEVLGCTAMLGESKLARARARSSGPSARLERVFLDDAKRVQT